MIIRCVIWKDMSKVLKPPGLSDTDWQNTITANNNALSDFENNHKSAANVVMSERYPFDYETNYSNFSKNIDGTSITWANVLMYEDNLKYVLYVDNGR